MKNNVYHFYAPAQIAIDDGKRHLDGVAYSGQVITDHPSLPRVVFDLSTTTLDTPAP